jgi:hypothetical protein
MPFIPSVTYGAKSISTQETKKLQDLASRVKDTSVKLGDKINMEILS